MRALNIQAPRGLWSAIVLACAALFVAPVPVAAQSISLAWDANSPSENVVGYQVHVGITSGTYGQTFDAGNSTTFTFNGAIPGTRYYFAVTAYRADNVSSPMSNEVTGKINVGPTLTQPVNQTGAVGAALPLQLVATDDGDPLTYSATGLPAGLSVNGSTGLISGSPTTAGTYNVTATVSDGSLSSSRSFTWTINPRLTITSLTSNLASPQIVGTSIVFTATGTGGIPPYQYKFSVSSNGGSTYSVVRNWATGNTYTWTPSTVNSNYRVKVDARSANVTVDVAEGTSNVAYNITSAPPPTADSVTPASGSGATQSFQLRYSDPGGATRLTTVWVWFNETFAPTSANSCMAYYDRAANRLYVIDDAGAAWQSAVLGSGTLENSSCAINLASTTATVSGTTLTLNLATTFKAAFAGPKNVYQYAASGGANSGWQTRGTWTVPAPQGGVIGADSVTPNTGSGATQTFALQYSDTAGAVNLSTVWVWFNATFASSSAQSCMAYVNRATNAVLLLNDAGTEWAAATLGSGGTLQNSQCAIGLAGSSAVTSGTTLTVNLAMTFAAGFAGAKNVYMYAANAAANSGWQTRGTWTVPGGGAPAVGAVSATPNAGTGASQTFTLQYSDSTGATNLTTAWLWVNATFAASSANSCMVYYDRPAHMLYLINDAGTAWLTGAVGGGGTLQNSQCAIALGSSTAVTSGTTLTLTVPLTFKPAFAGAKNLYLYAANGAGVNSGWQTRGTWTVPAGGVTVGADAVTPNAGAGTTQTFALQYSDSLGATDLETVWVWFNATFASSSANTCMLYYDRTTSQLNLINNAGTAWLPAALGSGTLQNNRCSINLAASSVTLSGNTLTLNLAVTFKSASFGTKNIYMYAESLGGLNSGWQTRGSWTAQ